MLCGCEDGVFLVRDSIHFQGDCTLSVAVQGRIDHYRIMCRGGLLEVDGGDCSFPSLIDLVQVLWCVFAVAPHDTRLDCS